MNCSRRLFRLSLLIYSPILCLGMQFSERSVLFKNPAYWSAQITAHLRMMKCDNLRKCRRCRWWFRSRWRSWGSWRRGQGQSVAQGSNRQLWKFHSHGTPCLQQLHQACTQSKYLFNNIVRLLVSFNPIWQKVRFDYSMQLSEIEVVDIVVYERGVCDRGAILLLASVQL